MATCLVDTSPSFCNDGLGDDTIDTLQGEDESQTLPSSPSSSGDVDIPKSGAVLARLSSAYHQPIRFKKWKQYHWMRRDGTLMLFKTEQDFSDYSKCALAYGFYTERQRDLLIHTAIDFGQELGNKCVRKYTVTEIKQKEYVDDQGLNRKLHQFKLERWVDLGPKDVAAFASENLEEIEALHSVIFQTYDSAVTKLPPSP